MLFKLVLCGDSGVGQHSWFKRVLENTYVESNIAWIGVDFGVKDIGTDRLQIWYTAGQERFRSITRPYFKDAHCMIMMCDLTRRETFNHLNRWHEEIRQHATPDIPVYLVATKADLTSRLAVSHDELYEFASQYSIIRRCFITSAKTGEGVQESIEQITRDLTGLTRTYEDMYGVEITYDINQFKADYLKKYAEDQWKNRQSQMLQMINNSRLGSNLNFHTILAHIGKRTKVVLKVAGFEDLTNIRINTSGYSISRRVPSNFVHGGSSIRHSSLNSLLSIHAEGTRVSPAISTTDDSRSFANYRPTTSSTPQGSLSAQAAIFSSSQSASSSSSASFSNSLFSLAVVPSASASEANEAAVTGFRASRMNAAVSRAAAAMFASSSKNNDKNNQKKLPEEYECSIGYEIMSDPVTLETGQTYERKNIKRWLQNNNTCPNTGKVLQNKELLIPNVALRQAIERYNHSVVTKEDKAISKF